MWFLAFAVADAVAQQSPWAEVGQAVLCVYRYEEPYTYVVTLDLDDLHFVTLGPREYACTVVSQGFHDIRVVASESPFAVERQEWKDAITLEAGAVLDLKVGFRSDRTLQIESLVPARVRKLRANASEAPRESMGLWTEPIRTDGDGQPIVPQDPATLPAEAPPVPGARP